MAWHEIHLSQMSFDWVLYCAALSRAMRCIYSIELKHFQLTNRLQLNLNSESKKYEWSEWNTHGPKCNIFPIQAF